MALEKCKKESNMLKIILVQDFCPLKIKITGTLFPGGFHLISLCDHCINSHKCFFIILCIDINIVGREIKLVTIET